MEMDDFISRSNSQLPTGLEILNAQEISLKERPLMAQIDLASYIVRIPDMAGDIDPKIRSILDMDHIWIERERRSAGKTARGAKSKSKTSKFVDIKPLIRSIGPWKRVNGAMELEMLLGDGSGGKVRPEEVVRLILDDLVKDIKKDDMLSTIQIHKTGSIIERQGQFCSPMEIG